MKVVCLAIALMAVVPAPYFFPVMGVLSLAWFGSRVAATASDVAERFAAEARPAWPLSRTAYV